jgi:hypothetical protein
MAVGGRRAVHRQAPAGQSSIRPGRVELDVPVLFYVAAGIDQPGAFRFGVVSAWQFLAAGSKKARKQR